ncbi:MAG: 2-oxoacid:acceptor oxidoreductase family protein [Bacillota bacterium]
MLEMRIHGRGGQGVVTMAELLVKAALKDGREAQTLPFFGVERRGAAVKTAVRFDSSPIKVRSLSYHPDLLVLMHENLLDIGLSQGISPEGYFIVNGQDPVPVRGIQWLVDAAGIAIQNGLIVGGEPFINIPMLGALCRVFEIPFSTLEETIREQWEGEKVEPNVTAAKEAYESIKQVEEVGFNG